MNIYPIKIYCVFTYKTYNRNWYIKKQKQKQTKQDKP